MANHVVLSADEIGRPVRTERPDDHGWLGGWVYQETQIELWSASILILWSIHMMRLPSSPVLEPVTRAMYQLAHVRPPALMVFMLLMGIAQAVAAYFLYTPVRRVLLFTGFCYYLFCVLCFWRLMPGYPGAFITISFALFSFVRFLQMCGRRP